jgi:DNA-binding protein HU-beta
MKKSDLVEVVAASTNQPKAQVASAVGAVFEEISKALSRGDRVQLSGFGTFEVRKRKARRARHPQTGAAMKVGATKAPAFKAGKTLREAVKVISEDQVEHRLAQYPEKLERVREGDMVAFYELLEVGTGARIKSVRSRAKDPAR